MRLDCDLCELGALVRLGEPHALLDAVHGGAHAAYGDPHVGAKELLSELLDLWCKGGREHEGLTALVHVLLCASRGRGRVQGVSVRRQQHSIGHRD